MDIHHLINKVYATKMIDRFDTLKALSIALPTNEHYLLSKYRSRIFNNKNELIVAEINNLANLTSVPAHVLNQIYSRLEEYM